MKTCSKCKLNKDVSEFSKDKTKKDGFRYQCRVCQKTRKNQYYLDNKNKIKEYRKEHYKEYYELNKDKLIKKTSSYIKKRRQEDPLFKLQCNIRSLILLYIKRRGFSKKTKTHEILGCDSKTFKLHLENQFTDGMNWNNQGKWHLDHIYPVSLARDQKHVIELNHYTNFQPLWASDNLRKGNRV